MSEQKPKNMNVSDMQNDQMKYGKFPAKIAERYLGINQVYN